MSDSFSVSNGTRKGSILSPYLSTRHIRDLLHMLVNVGVGCSIIGHFISALAYADDLVAPS